MEPKPCQTLLINVLWCAMACVLALSVYVASLGLAGWANGRGWIADETMHTLLETVFQPLNCWNGPGVVTLWAFFDWSYDHGRGWPTPWSEALEDTARRHALWLDR